MLLRLASAVLHGHAMANSRRHCRSKQAGQGDVRVGMGMGVTLTLRGWAPGVVCWGEGGRSKITSPVILPADCIWIRDCASV